MKHHRKWSTNVEGGASAGPTSIFHESAVGAVQYSSGQGKTQFVVSALLIYGWLLKSAGNWQSNTYKPSIGVHVKKRGNLT